MYEAFYNLKRQPFNITPDPYFLFSTTRHDEALAALNYGVLGRKGLVVLTGEVGTGKTLLLRCLLQLLRSRQDIAYAYLFNSRLSSTEFLEYVVRDLGLPYSGKNHSAILFDLCKYVITRGLSKLYTVLIVDEAHHLSEGALEEIRLLTNLETTREKLLQIVLVGQPELDEKLDSVRLRQLKQRIVIRKHLDPMDSDETKGYIQRRLRLVGATSDTDTLFPPNTIAAVYRYSRGIPRVINTICENALITAYARKMQSVTPNVIEDVVGDLRLGVVQATERKRVIGETELQQAATTLFELNSSLQKRGRPETDLCSASAGQVGRAYH
jgi:general secretion pathway protein A